MKTWSQAGNLAETEWPFTVCRGASWVGLQQTNGICFWPNPPAPVMAPNLPFLLISNTDKNYAPGGLVINLGTV